MFVAPLTLSLGAKIEEEEEERETVRPFDSGLDFSFLLAAFEASTHEDGLD